MARHSYLRALSYLWLIYDPRKFDPKLGIQSQLVTCTTLRKFDDKSYKSIATNLVVQIATKLGGVSTTIEEETLNIKNTMVVGLSIIQSRYFLTCVAGVTTYDRYFAQYYSDCETQDHGKKAINEDFCHRFIEAVLNEWEESNNELPHRILVYR